MHIGKFRQDTGLSGTRMYNSLPNSIKSASDQNLDKSFEDIKEISDKFLGQFEDKPTGGKLANNSLRLLRPWY